MKERKELNKAGKKEGDYDHVNDGWMERGGGRGGAGGERLNVSTWLLIQSDYHRLTAPTGRHPWLLRLQPPLPLQSAGEWKRALQGDRESRGDSRLSVCVCDRVRWVSSGGVSDKPPPQPLRLPSPFTIAALPRARGGTSRVQRARRPPARRRQLVEAAASRAAIGRRRDEAECKLSNQFEEEKEKEKRKKKSLAKYINRSLSCWGLFKLVVSRWKLSITLMEGSGNMPRLWPTAFLRITVKIYVWMFVCKCVFYYKSLYFRHKWSILKKI